MPDLKAIPHLRWKTAQIPVKNWFLGLDDFRPYDSASEIAKTLATEFVEGFHQRWVNPHDLPEDRTQVGRGLIVAGPPGTGKSLLTTIILSEVHARYNWKIHWQAYPDHLRNLIRAQHDDGSDEWKAALSAVQRVESSVLVTLDDLAKEHKTQSGFAEGETDRLLRGRFQAGKPTLISTNLPVKNWGEVYNPSMQSFVRESFDIVALSGADQR